ncbi:MAG: glycosidase [Candidatus Neomarinimicrobiota bacterium]|nr:glycosidase [Candidatus Neomarinimicrobiota bacterium]RKY49573.1 MAG: glycosidase [Candidatus Neomarinimicrobiota bacterium]
MITLRRISKDPIFLPDPEHEWERAAVFNAGAVYENGRFHMIYRATNIGGHARYGEYINQLGYATSDDLIHWDRREEPIVKNDVPQELRGPEDPRIVKIDDTFYMTYTGFGNRFPGDYRICLATSRDLIHWDRKGILLDEENKNSAFFPRKINGEYILLHRRHPDIWIAYSKDLKHFYNHTKIMTTINDDWQSARIGIAGPPVKHPEGWLLFYHAVDETNTYRLGVALLEYDDPTKILARQSRPVIEPELDWEIHGFVPNVIFSCATMETKDQYVVIYAGADTVIGAAVVDKRDLIFEEKDRIKV